MTRTTNCALRMAASLLLLALSFGAAWAHETRILGPEGGTQYAVIVGMLSEPVFTEVRTGLDLIVRDAATQEQVEGLETSLRVSITAPTGEVRVQGFIGALEIDETYPREVADGQSLRFP